MVMELEQDMHPQFLEQDVESVEDLLVSFIYP